jgi:hypothetical protein
MLFEIMIGGAGRIFDFGGVTLRMIFFVGAIFLMSYLFISGNRINKSTLIYVLVFLWLLIFSAVNGFLHQANFELILENFLMNSFFIIFPFFEIMIKDKDDVNVVMKLYKISAIILATFYFTILIIIYFELIEFNVLYDFLLNPEFGFRSETAFFYKGFLFMCCGLFFLNSDSNFSNRISQFFVFFAIVATFVRGFLLSIFSSYLVYVLFFKNFIYTLTFTFILILLLPFAFSYYLNVLGDRSDSDNIRTIQINEVKDRVDLFSFFCGKGFGSGVPIRENHFEINYLEIFYKQGLLGLAFWFTIFLDVFFKFKKAYSLGLVSQALPFFLAVVFLYIQSASNPFLSNSMGISIIFVSLISINVLIKEVELS